MGLLSTSSARLEQHLWFRCIAPIIVLGLLTYATWSFCHQLCYNAIYRKFGQRSVAIGLMVGEIILVLFLIFIWFQMVLIGPGRQPKLLPYKIMPEDESDTDGEAKEGSQGTRQSTNPPRIYQCDPQGYPIWCTSCQSIKANRTHHSSTLGYCIPRFDHYCFWIGTVVGRKNYRLFVQFAFYFWAFAIFVIVSTASFLPRIIRSRPHIPRVNPNILITLGLCGMATLMVGPLFLAHTYYMMVNRTSLEIIATKRRSRATNTWLCCYNPVDGLRYVFEFKALEVQDFWNKRNILTNLKEFLGNNYLMWFVPFGTNIKYSHPKSSDVADVLGPYQELCGKRLYDELQHRIETGNYVAAFKAFGDINMGEN
ncbi:LAQU0S11e04104g1_1 [Lachancea quebecensis]|uniref:Palmitoyltransferase n=1 Tax=Lachancea quebecensis TaxID=1654605 RepID=A0A0P1L2R2_9SACH|nr:LAQU0S11e04104g1_1 [Lachancea quebecensis]